MSDTNLFVAAGLSFLTCLISSGSKSWNVFCISLIVLACSVMGIVFQVIL